MHSVHSESCASEQRLLQCLLGLTLFANHSLYTSLRKGVPELAMTAFVSESKFISEHVGQAENFVVIERRMLLNGFQFHVIYKHLATHFCYYHIPTNALVYHIFKISLK